MPRARVQASSKALTPFPSTRPGRIAGRSLNANSSYYGFIRGVSGVISSFAAPDAGTGSGQGTLGESINNLGAIAGYYYDAGSVIHGFLLKP
jgi:hypothetical protein